LATGLGCSTAAPGGGGYGLGFDGSDVTAGGPRFGSDGGAAASDGSTGGADVAVGDGSDTDMPGAAEVDAVEADAGALDARAEAPPCAPPQRP
jgi:hypothetical protein